MYRHSIISFNTEFNNAIENYAAILYDMNLSIIITTVAQNTYAFNIGMYYSSGNTYHKPTGGFSGSFPNNGGAVYTLRKQLLLLTNSDELICDSLQFYGTKPLQYTLNITGPFNVYGCDITV